MYLSLYCKGSKRVTQSFTVRGSWRPNRIAIYWPPPLLWLSALYLSRSPGLLNRRPRGPALCWMMAFFTTSYHQLVSKTPSGVPRAPSAGCGFPYHILSPTSLIPKSSGASRAPSARRSLPHLISNFSGPQPSVFLSLQNYIIVQCPLNRPLNPWNGMFDRHQAEITVMQFTGHSLLVHHSVVAQWDLHLVPYYQPSSPARFLLINGHWDVSLPLSLEWHVCPGRRSKYY